MIIDSRPKLPQPAVVNVSFATPGEDPSVPPSPTSTLVESTPPPYNARLPPQTRCTPAYDDLENAEGKRIRRRNWLRLVFRVAFCLWVIPSAYVVLTQLQKLAQRVVILVPPLSPTLERPDLHDLTVEQQYRGVASCGKWRHNSAERASFQTYLPEHTTRVFLHNLAGHRVSGSLRVWSRSSALHHPQLLIEARSKYKKVLKALYASEVCLMPGDTPGARGLVISQINDEDDEIDYNINLIIPERSTNLQLKTVLPRFRQIIGMPGASLLRLGSVSLGGPVSELSMDSAEVARLQIDTVDSFYGSLTVTESLSIKSEAGSINANVTLLFRGQPLKVSFGTDHEPIDAVIRVKDVDSNDPTFGTQSIPLNITATTGHAPIALGVVYNSSNIVLGLNATTRLAPLYVQVPPSYEGTFNFSAFSSEAEILSLPSNIIQDPSGKGRKRLVRLHSPNPNNTITSNANGSIKWVYDPDSDNEDGEREVMARESSPAFKGSHLQATTLLAKTVLDLTGSARLFSETSSWGDGCSIRR